MLDLDVHIKGQILVIRHAWTVRVDNRTSVTVLRGDQVLALQDLVYQGLGKFSLFVRTEVGSEGYITFDVDDGVTPWQ